LSRTSAEIEKPVESTERLFARSSSQLGFLTEKQFRVLSLRSRGYSQQEIAFELGLSRASVSMIEGRAKKQIELARQTLRMFKITQTHHKITVAQGTRLQQIPMEVLREADRYGIHLRSNMVDILRIVKKRKSDILKDGRISDKIMFTFNERGKVTLL
jgi:HTH-type transcriptional regulator, fmd operon transcriptional regulator